MKRRHIAAALAAAALLLAVAPIVNTVSDARAEAAQSVELDLAGDHDGQAEIVTIDGERITEISIRFDCETMGNARCGA